MMNFCDDVEMGVLFTLIGMIFGRCIGEGNTILLAINMRSDFQF